MNPTLVRIIRERMQSQTTEQLLDVWVINDRATWSPETFEAVRSILADRGKTNLPPQNDPPPVAQRRTLHNDPVAAYWMEWLRPVLWISIVSSVIGVARAATVVGPVGELIDAYGDSWVVRWPVLSALVIDVVLPLWRLVASIACLRARPGGRVALVLYAITAVAVGAGAAVLNARTAYQSAAGLPFPTFYLLTSIQESANALILPLTLLIFLRRPEIRSIFVPRGGAGFEPGLAPPATPPAENASP